MELKFLKFGIAAMASMFLGSHVVYTIYQPMSDFNDYVKEAELKRKNEKLSKPN